MAERCTEQTEVYSRVCGFFRPVAHWNPGKQEEFRERRTFVVSESGKGRVLAARERDAGSHDPGEPVRIKIGEVRKNGKN
jgi:ribonucleoside-triphosphate reductase